jgi:ketosteroid isomerase-like protein
VRAILESAMTHRFNQRRRVLAALLAACSLSGIAPAAGQTVSADPDAAIRALIGKYAESINGADTTLASTVWANSPDVSFIHPMGHEHGWGEIKTNVYEKTMGELFSQRTLKVKDVVVHVYGDAAWAEFDWDFSATLRKDGSPVTTHGRETQIYRRVESRWLLVHVHYSELLDR